ncbi:3-phosphoshikimate 1-carboxyvinyltransferase [Pseudooceanicola sp. CBS1P-1]|uniref:3-phosphoshikimate 1-carboxyvinyltransferase n=1 Tax=Pseudooceanicola albus TaxID=2692189 RepID=A0A6L7G412_9RHOB|nr:MULTISPECIES: 3-phosphoshikimate 1-carboxyvinyltransferase [Pseudooceanicola]MBT9384546.1 3-phosphoshikimate 1-carboxyvinyltransferase [Pseudooceanicola endophyticus]MXN18248.1 3-phosphoshikimate 1-carboxyvinyltransferase [Pseudooceanicola albus]
MPAASLHAVDITPPAQPLTGRVALPGSKSITNRALLVAALSKGTSRLSGALTSDDTRHMMTALRAMGVTVTQEEETTFTVTSPGYLTPPEAPLFLGNAGTAVRFLTAACAFLDGEVVVTGDEHMQKRPIRPLVEALNRLGVAAEAPSGCPPVVIRGNPGALASDQVRVLEIDGSLSSQYVSALLMAAPVAPMPIRIEVTGGAIGSRGYVDITLSVMRAFGAEVEEVGPLSWLVHPTGYRAADYAIEPDASAATYLWAAEVLTGGAIDIGARAEEMSQPDARAHAVIAQFPHMPAEIVGDQMQDAIPTLAVMAMFNETPVRFTGIANLRVKECDRIRALSAELNRILPGLAREEGDDLIVAGNPAYAGQSLPAEIETYADHRIAMCFALAGLKVQGIRILDPGCTAKTYPQYWRDLAALGVAVAPVQGA